MKKLWKIFCTFLTLIGFCVFALAVVGAVGLSKATPKLPARIVLGYTFYGTPADAPEAPGWLAQFMPVEPTLAEVTSAIYKAAKDPHVEALAVRLSDGDYNWAAVQEIRAAIDVFKQSGKKTYVYAESYGDVMPGMAVYYLASAFDEIWVQPVGSVSITGFHAEMPYFRKTLEMVGVQPDIIQKGTYKTAPENALLDAMSDAQRETIHGILSSMMTDFFDGISKGRNIPAERIGPLIDGAPYSALEAKERKLVDTVGYEDQLMAKLFPEKDADPREMVDAVDYYNAGNNPVDVAINKEKKILEKNNKINDVAVVYVTGMIVSGGAEGAGVMAEPVSYADEISDAILGASEDETVGAIILRVNSPGGSPTASETIRRAVEVAKGRGKYVVVSMSSEAASGGYWVSVDADKIFAMPGTITGSIGVFGGKASLAGIWDKLGVNWDGVELGANASIWSMNRPYTDEQREAVSRLLDDIYDGFIDRVSKGRKFGPEVVETMAQGRVWTGRQAKERGLIDAFGGYHEALADVAAKLSVPDADHLEVYTLPQPSDPITELRSMFMGVMSRSQIFAPLIHVFSIWDKPLRGITYAQGFAIGG